MLRPGVRLATCKSWSCPGDFYALQESTGQVVWQRTLDYEQVGNNGNCKNVRGIVGTATVTP